jgi:hypothetical protein
MKGDSRASLLACTFANPCLGYKPKVRVTTIGFLLSQVHQELCQDNHTFDKPFEEIIQNL